MLKKQLATTLYDLQKQFSFSFIEIITIEFLDWTFS